MISQVKKGVLHYGWSYRLNAFELLMVGSSSEYILRHAKVDLLVVRDKDKPCKKEKLY